jgi:hypothetical protein
MQRLPSPNRAGALSLPGQDLLTRLSTGGACVSSGKQKGRAELSNMQWCAARAW